MAGAKWLIGATVEITNQERGVLEELAKEMVFDARVGQVGWFKSYLEGHRHAHAIIKDIFTRSHASS